MANMTNIACLQIRPMPDFEAALGEALPLAEAAVQAGAEMLFLPEYCGGLQSSGAALNPAAAKESEHPVLRGLQDFAATRGVWIMVGSLAVKSANKLINRGFMIDGRGTIQGRYDKIHMFDIDLSETEVYRESDTIDAGRTAVIHDTPLGKIGHTICYDLRFPHLYRTLAQNGAEILAAPAAFTKKTGQAHWHVLNRARAIENTCYMISPCAIGFVPGGGECYGHSVVVNPWGEVIADGGTLPGLVQAKIDLDKVKEARARIPSLSHDRPLTLEEDSDRRIA